MGFIVFLNNAYAPNEVENGEEGASVDEYKVKMEMQRKRFIVFFTLVLRIRTLNVLFGSDSSLRGLQINRSRMFSELQIALQGKLALQGQWWLCFLIAS